MKPRAYLLKTDGTETAIEPRNGTDFTFEELYPIMECDMIEIIRLPDGRIMLLDEEGNWSDKPTNERATVLAYNALTMGRGIVGHTVVCEDSMIR